MGRKFHDWFLNSEYPQGLKEYMKKYNLSIQLAKGFKLGPDIQTLYFSFIRAVPVDLLPSFNIANQPRVGRINEWADEDTLLRMPFIEYTPNIIGKKIHLPRISLEGITFNSNNWMNPIKYDLITDGNHRFSKAVELGLSHVLCEVMESFEVTRDEMGKEIENQEDDTYYLCKLCEKPVVEFDFQDHFSENHDVDDTYNEYCKYCDEIIPNDDFDHFTKRHPNMYKE